MNNNIMFTIFAGLTLLVGTVGINAFAQNVTEGANQTRGPQGVVNETGEAAGNVTEGANQTRGPQGVVNETGEAAGNVTEGLGTTVNETGESLSNATGNVIEWIQDVVNGSSP